MARQYLSKELVIKNKDYVFLLGTLNKKNPETIYLRSKVRIQQIISSEPSKLIEEFTDRLIGFINNELRKDAWFYPSNIISVDFPDNIVKFNRINYFRLEIHLRPFEIKPIEGYKEYMTDFINKIIAFIESVQWQKLVA